MEVNRPWGWPIKGLTVRGTADNGGWSSCIQEIQHAEYQTHSSIKNQRKTAAEWVSHVSIVWANPSSIKAAFTYYYKINASQTALQTHKHPFGRSSFLVSETTDAWLSRAESPLWSKWQPYSGGFLKKSIFHMTRSCCWCDLYHLKTRLWHPHDNDILKLYPPTHSLTLFPWHRNTGTNHVCTNTPSACNRTYAHIMWKCPHGAVFLQLTSPEVNISGS